MDRNIRVQVWAGLAMLALCVVIGVVEGAAVLRLGSWTWFALWVAAFLVFLVGVVLATVRTTPTTTAGSIGLVAVPVLAAGVIVLLSPSRGGLSYILLVLTAAIAAIHLDVRGIGGVIVWNSVVVLATTAALGPFVDRPAPLLEQFLMVFLYTLLQAASAAMIWAQQRVERTLQELSVAHVELRSTSALLAESSQAQERLRISRELHDVLGHQLTVLSVELEVASHRVEGPAREHVLRAHGLAKDLLADVRSVVGSQRDRNFDLPAALARVVEEIPHPRVHLGLEPDLTAEDEHAATVVRAVQEIATNTIRHAQADNLWIRLAATDDGLRLEAHDDGVGTRAVTPGNGLRGLRERVESVGGRVEVDGAAGFRVRVTLPARQGVPA
ncbi:MAG TPA: histidine kinase [Actinomycetaceae bacterium]|nr:histidine kinase [Actinomycetaceae bacterium]